MALTAREYGHVHGEAFMLMWYACKACGHRERIWNSRDGVTPFGCCCPSCGDIMRHIDWQRDEFAPQHKLLPGQHFWRDGTPAEAEKIMRQRIERYREQFPQTPEQEAQLIREAREGKLNEFKPGWPMLDTA